MITLAAGDLHAEFVPEAGMVGASLRHRGEELLGQRHGLEGYVADHQTFGIPLLHPWANRVATREFPVAGRTVRIDPDVTPLRFDETGLPIHGLLAGAPWEVQDAGAAHLSATFDYAAHPALLAAFPFPHELRIDVTLDETALGVVTSVRATGDVPVPVAFGWHPYLQLPGVPRDAWHVEVPVRERLVVDERKLPTGERESVHVDAGPLGARTFDDGYTAPPPGTPFVLAGGGRRIEVAFDAGYGFCQVFAPDVEDVVAYEPMTAPTNALVDGGPDLLLLAPGEQHTGAFTITVA